MGRQRVPLDRSLRLEIRCLEEGQVPTHEPPHQGNEPEDEEEQDGGGGSHALTLSFEPTDVLLTSGPVDRWCGFDRDRPHHPRRLMRFADELVGPVLANLEQDGIIDRSLGFPGIEGAVPSHGIVGQELAGPEEPDRVPFLDRDLGGAESEIRTVHGDDHDIGLLS